jgi:hypothetical protein
MFSLISECVPICRLWVNVTTFHPYLEECTFGEQVSPSLSLYLSIYLHLYLPLYLSLSLSLYLYLSLSLSLYPSLSISLSRYLSLSLSLYEDLFHLSLSPHHVPTPRASPHVAHHLLGGIVSGLPFRLELAPQICRGDKQTGTAVCTQLPDAQSRVSANTSSRSKQIPYVCSVLVLVLVCLCVCVLPPPPVGENGLLLASSISQYNRRETNSTQLWRGANGLLLSLLYISFHSCLCRF